jgi:hypothetical protein
LISGKKIQLFRLKFFGENQPPRENVVFLGTRLAKRNPISFDQKLCIDEEEFRLEKTLSPDFIAFFKLEGNSAATDIPS